MLKAGELDIGLRGVGVASVVFAAWGVSLVLLMQVELSWWALAWAPLAIALRSFLNVGLFISAHDAMHGTLWPSRPRINHTIGRAAVFLYAGFSYDVLWKAHIEHHRAPGTEADPDFSEKPGDGPVKWFTAFMIRYSSIQQFLVMTLYLFGLLAFSVSIWNVILFWAVPAILSAMQLFYFGTYQPHRPLDKPFSDQHRARTVERPVWLSFITCYHFGYHLEHHRYPWVPWWALPALRKTLRTPS